MAELTSQEIALYGPTIEEATTLCGKDAVCGDAINSPVTMDGCFDADNCVAPDNIDALNAIKAIVVGLTGGASVGNILKIDPPN